MNAVLKEEPNLGWDDVLIAMLDALTDEERLKIFSRYCKGCGCIEDPEEWCRKGY